MPIIRFAGGIEFDPATGRLHRGDAMVRLEPQPSAVLRALTARAGELVTHDELRQEVWDRGTHVKLPDSLHYCVRQIRAALGDDSRQPTFIETIPRRGYRLRPECLAAPEPRRRPVARWAVRLTVAASLIAVAAAIEQRPNNHHELAVSLVIALHDLVF